jgi:hypothetical protein
MTLILGFSAGTGLTDRIIQLAESRLLPHHTLPLPLATHCWITHATSGVAVLIEAVAPQGVVLDNASSVVSRRSSVEVRRYALPCTLEDEAAIWDAARARLGDPYDYLGAVLAGAFCLLGWRDLFYQSNRARFMCSELVLTALRARLDVLEGLPGDCIVPAELESWAAVRGCRV